MLQQPTLLRALRAVPTARVIWEGLNVTANDERLLLFWVDADDYEAFEGAMNDDPTVTAPRRLTTFSDRRLYQAEQIDVGRAQSVHQALIAVGAIIQSGSATHEGWELQIAFPDHEALQHFSETCADQGVDLTLLSKYEQSNTSDGYRDFGLTDKQRDALMRAVEGGYFKVPRETDLKMIADEMGISHQAASERMRRATEVLVRNTIAPEQCPSPGTGT